MNRSLFAVLVSLIAAVLMTGCTSPPQVINASVGKEFIFNTSVGREIVITVDANPATGYNWLEEYDNSRLKLVNAEYKPRDNTSGVVGAGGTQTYHFKTLMTGKTQMTLIYKRAWEQQALDQKVFTIIIK